MKKKEKQRKTKKKTQINSSLIQIKVTNDETKTNGVEIIFNIKP